MIYFDIRADEEMERLLHTARRALAWPTVPEEILARWLAKGMAFDMMQQEDMMLHFLNNHLKIERK